MGGSKEVTVGYRYYFGIHMGIGRGPVDELVEIRVGDRRAWSGSVTSNARININKGYLFGGDEAEGGIVGGLDVLMGEPDQGVLGRLKNMLGGLVPAFRGMFTLFFDGQIGAMNPYPKPWKIRYRRHTKGWDGACWYPEKVKIELADGQIHAMNPAHMLVACQTDRRWGRGLSDNRIDYQSYTEAADRLYSEGFGLCLLWTRKESVNAFMQTIIDHIGGAQFISRRTGLMTLRLIRDDYDPEDLPLFTYDSGLLSIEEDTLSAGETTPNEVVVNYRDPITNEDRSAREQNLGAIQSAGTVISTSADYPGLPTHELGSRVAQREIRAQRGVRKFKVRLARRGAALEPASVFRISAPDDGIDQIVLRVGRIEAGTVTDAAITVTALLDVFGLPANVYTEQQPSTWQPPNRTAQPALYQRLLEVSYRDLVRRTTDAQRAALESDAGFLAALGVRPTGLSLNYSLTTRVGSGAFEKRDVGDWAPTAVLDAGIGPDDELAILAGGIDLDLVKPGRAALLGEEIIRVDSIDLETMEAEISRACVDTVPVDHPAGARIWFYEAYAAGDPTEYVDGDTVDAKLLARTTGELLDPALATTMSLGIAARQARPYPPAHVRYNGQAWPDAIVGPINASWAHRDRLLQQDVLVSWTDGSIGPEPDTTYSVQVVRADNGTELAMADGIGGTSATVAPSDYSGPVTLRAWSTRNGLDSWQRYERDVAFIPEPMAISGSVGDPLTVGVSYSAQFAANVGVAPIEWEIIEGAVPAGMGLDSVSGELFGSPSTGGSYDFTVRATDTQGFYVDRQFTGQLVEIAVPYVVDTQEEWLLGELEGAQATSNGDLTLRLAGTDFSSDPELIGGGYLYSTIEWNSSEQRIDVHWVREDAQGTTRYFLVDEVTTASPRFAFDWHLSATDFDSFAMGVVPSIRLAGSNGYTVYLNYSSDADDVSAPSIRAVFANGAQVFTGWHEVSEGTTYAIAIEIDPSTGEGVFTVDGVELDRVPLSGTWSQTWDRIEFPDPRGTSSNEGPTSSVTDCWVDNLVLGRDGAGSRLSPPIALGGVGVAASSSISWVATEPTGTAVIVETSLDDGASWDEATNGGSVPGITAGMDLTGGALLVRVSLSTTAAPAAPVVDSLSVDIQGQ